jgi:serine/threonine protein kinase
MGNAATKRSAATNEPAATSGPEAYLIKLTEENKLGEGQYGTVHKIMTRDNKTACAAKIFKVPFKIMSTLEQLGYDRELQILQDTSHPFVVKYIEEFVY